MGLTITNIEHSILGNKAVAFFDVAFDSSYVTGGESLKPDVAGMYDVAFVHAVAQSGYSFEYDYTNKKLKAYYPSSAEESHTHASGTLADAASGAGASHNHAFTGTSPVSSLNLGTPAFSGTGLTAAGQAITTSDNQTMTENQCAGMWLIPVTQATPAVLILSNTAVEGAAAVLTVQGSAFTDAGTYKIVKSLTPVGTNAAEATHTHAVALDGGVSAAATGTANVGVEVGDTDDLSALTSVKVMMIGS